MCVSSGLTFCRTEAIYFKSQKRCFEQPHLAQYWHRDPREKQTLQVKPHSLVKLLNQNTPNTSAGAETGLRAETAAASGRPASGACAEGPTSKIKRFFSKVAALAGRRPEQRLQEGHVGWVCTRGRQWAKSRGYGRHTYRGGPLRRGGHGEAAGTRRSRNAVPVRRVLLSLESLTEG